MRCRECGLELDARDRLPNGAYQCPECGAIYHTASSSRVSPSPWRRRRKNPFGTAADVLTERHFGLPLWAWSAAVAIVLIIALILLLNLGGGKKDGTGEAGGADVSDAGMVEATVEPSVPLDLSAGDASDAEGAEEQPPEAPESTPITVNSTTGNTGVKLNDFTVGFDWAMSRLKYNEMLTLQSSDVSTTGENVNTYVFQDWFTLQLVVIPDSEIIRSATATAQLEAGSADNTRAVNALAVTMYAFDNTVTPNYARSQLSKMIGNNTEYCDRTGFSASLTTSSSEYTLAFNGKL